MTREQLRALADRFLDYVNSPDSDPNKLLGLVAQDLKTPLTYPGAPSGYVGVKGIIEKLHAALSEYQLKLITPVIDEQECRVVFFVKSMGVQTGEWRGFPGSGNAFDHFGFLMMRIDLKNGLIDEMNMLFQETLFLKQIGVIPYGYA